MIFFTGSEMKMFNFMDVIYLLPGGENLSRDFCNYPVNVSISWMEEPIASILLCGRLARHDGDCDPTPPISDIQ